MKHVKTCRRKKDDREAKLVALEDRLSRMISSRARGLEENYQEEEEKWKAEGPVRSPGLETQLAEEAV